MGPLGQLGTLIDGLKPIRFPTITDAIIVLLFFFKILRLLLFFLYNKSILRIITVVIV